MSESSFNLGTVIEDAKKVITNPIGFYREMPTSGGYANPLIFVVVVAAITGVITAILSLIGLGMPDAVAGGMALGAIIFFPIISIIASFIGAAILFVIWKLMGSEKNYETAYRCVAYAFAIFPITVILSIIPYLEPIVRALWSCFLFYTASVEVHKLKASTAKVVFGILAALGLLFGVSSEHTARNLSKTWGNLGEQIEKNYDAGSIGKAIENLENVEDMTPEEAGKQFGEFLKGMEQFSKGLEESVKEQQAESN